MLPAERRRFLATVGRRLTAQALTRRDPQRRYPILLTLLAQSAVDVLDEVVQLFDQAVSARESRARHKLAERWPSGQDRRGPPGAAGGDPGRSWPTRRSPTRRSGGLIRGERIGLAPAAGRAPHRRRRGCHAITDTWPCWTPRTATCGSSPRRCWPRSSSPADPAADALLEAVDVLRELNTTGARKVPAGRADRVRAGAVARLPRRRRRAGDTTGYRHYWELCVLLALRDGLRVRGRVRARLAPLRRPGRLPAHPEAWARAAGGVLPRWSASRRPGGRAWPRSRRAGRRARRPGAGPRRRRRDRSGSTTTGTWSSRR